MSRLVELKISAVPGRWTSGRATEGSLLFALGALLPAYTITGFDASAHAVGGDPGCGRERTAWNRPFGAGFGRRRLDLPLRGGPGRPRACRTLPAKAKERSSGSSAACFPGRWPRPCCAAIVVAQYLCGLATVTSASRMAFAFARDGGIPFSRAVRWVCPRRRSPAVAIWMVATASVLFTLHTPVYSTITAVCTIFLYLSYVLADRPGCLGARPDLDSDGPLGPRALVSAACLAQRGRLPRTDRRRNAAAQRAIDLGCRDDRVWCWPLAWSGFARHRFPGPPQAALDEARRGT